MKDTQVSFFSEFIAIKACRSLELTRHKPEQIQIKRMCIWPDAITTQNPAFLNHETLRKLLCQSQLSTNIMVINHVL